MLSDEIRSCLLSVAEQLFSAWAEDPSEDRAILLFEIITVGNVLNSLDDIQHDKLVYRFIIDKLDTLFSSLHDFDSGGGNASYLYEAQLVAVLISLIKRRWKGEQSV